ncbi:MAG: glycosyltransferase [Cyanobacteria bacterium J007]|nr:MAG: glycosyltransferase [Cyanobacteria bacterium J007]
MFHFKADFTAFNSFSDITLSLAKHLTGLGIPVSLQRSEISAAFVAEDESNYATIAQLMKPEPYRRCQIKWSHYWPATAALQLDGELNFELFAINYHFTRDREPFDLWLQECIGNPYNKLAISQFCRDVLIQAGCNPERIFVLPLAFNPLLSELPFVAKPSENSGVKRILHCTSSADLYRFGTDLLLTAYCEEFYGDTQIELVLKEGQSQHCLLDRYIQMARDRFGTGMPRIRYIKRFLNKAELAQLYYSVDGFIAPFRGEGFAIKILDAFAAGLPVALPLYGGPTEYADRNNCYPIEYDLVPVGHCLDTQNLALRNAPHWAEPKISSLRQQLRAIVEDSQRFERAQKARNRALQFSWSAAAQRLESLVKERL